MAITLTCTCGRKQTVATERAGRTCACANCGKTMKVPAMGLPADVKQQPPKAPKPSINPSPLTLVLAGLLALMVVGGMWLAVRIATKPPAMNVEPVNVAGNTKREPTRPQEVRPPIDTNRESKKSPSDVVTQPIHREREPESPTPELLPMPVEKKDRLIEPVTPIDAMPYFLEAVKVANDLPNIFGAPIKLAEKKPNVMEPLKLVWKLDAEDTFYQELVVTQKPTFKIQGIVVVSLLQYGIVSRFRVIKINEDGSRVVEQKIESAKLLQADDLTKPLVADAVTQMVGKTFKLELSPKMDVTKFNGDVGGMKVAGGGLGLQMASLLDRDGWKELAQATFFQFDQPLKVKDTWSKPMSHNWGALGSWSGKTNYRYDGKQQNLHRVVYGLQLAYKAPTGGAVGLMKVTNANFQPQQAEGYLVFDSVRGRVIGAEERFRVKGVINANLLGQNTQIEIDEDQHFAIRIHDKLVP